MIAGVILRYEVVPIKRPEGGASAAVLLCLGEAIQAEGRLDHLLRHRAHYSLGLLARLEECDRRNARDPEVPGKRRLGVHVYLRHLYGALVLARDLVHHRRYLTTRPTPRRPEVHQHRYLGIQYFLLESVDRHRYGLAHEPYLLKSLHLIFSPFRRQALGARGRER